MPEFLTTRGITAKIENIIADAKEVLFLISPYLSYIPESIILRLEDALKKGVRLTLVFKSLDKIHPNEIQKLETLSGIDLFYNSNLHAKAFFNEKEAVITSFNLSGYSEKNNIEFGIHFTRIDSQAMFEKLVSESQMILKTSKPVPIFTLDEITEQNMTLTVIVSVEI